MKLTQLQEHEDGTVSFKVDMTPEEHQEMLQAALVRAMHLATAEKKIILEEYKCD